VEIRRWSDGLITWDFAADGKSREDEYSVVQEPLGLVVMQSYLGKEKLEISDWWKL